MSTTKVAEPTESKIKDSKPEQEEFHFNSQTTEKPISHTGKDVLLKKKLKINPN